MLNLLHQMHPTDALNEFVMSLHGARTQKNIKFPTAVKTSIIS
jgi:hypothetical protein